jgi:hypothetical protein
MARNFIIREPIRDVPTDETPHGCMDGWVYLQRLAVELSRMHQGCLDVYQAL